MWLRIGGNYNWERGYNLGSGRGLCFLFWLCFVLCFNGFLGVCLFCFLMLLFRGVLNCGYGCVFEFFLLFVSIVVFILGFKFFYCFVCVCVVIVGLFLLWIVVVLLFVFLLFCVFKILLGVIGWVEERRGLWICLGFVNGGLFGGLGCRWIECEFFLVFVMWWLVVWILVF